MHCNYYSPFYSLFPPYALLTRNKTFEIVDKSWKTAGVDKKEYERRTKNVIAFEHDSNIALSKSTHHVLIYIQFSQCRVIWREILVSDSNVLLTHTYTKVTWVLLEEAVKFMKLRAFNSKAWYSAFVRSSYPSRIY
jgi:hypothetical protein